MSLESLVAQKAFQLENTAVCSLKLIIGYSLSTCLVEMYHSLHWLESVLALHTTRIKTLATQLPS